MSILIKCAKCGVDRDFDEFGLSVEKTPGTLGEEATLTCPNCGTKMVLSAEVATTGEAPPPAPKPSPMKPPPPPSPESPPPAGGDSETGGEAPSPLEPIKDSVVSCDSCGRQWIGEANKKCSKCKKPVKKTDKKIEDAVQDMLKQVEAGVGIEKAVDGMFLGEAVIAGGMYSVKPVRSEDTEELTEWSGTFEHICLSKSNDVLYKMAIMFEKWWESYGSPQPEQDYWMCFVAGADAAMSFSNQSVGESTEWSDLGEEIADTWEGSISDFTTKFQSLMTDLGAQDLDFGKAVESLQTSGAMKINKEGIKLSADKGITSLAKFLENNQGTLQPSPVAELGAPGPDFGGGPPMMGGPPGAGAGAADMGKDWKEQVRASWNKFF